jgi:uncharacterized membrane protein
MNLSYLLALLSVAACTSQDGMGEPSGASCDAELSYAHDVGPFMQRYCAGCHASSVSLEQRRGAPGDCNLDTEQDVLEQVALIDSMAAAGPLAVNREMPPRTYTRQPSDAERALLGRWLACYVDSNAAQHEGAAHSH